MPTVKENVDEEEKDRYDELLGPFVTSRTTAHAPQAYSRRHSTLFETNGETQPIYISCVKPNDLQLPNQKIAKRSFNVFEVTMIAEEFYERYNDGLAAGGVTEGDDKEAIGQARTALQETPGAWSSQGVYLHFYNQIVVSILL